MASVVHEIANKLPQVSFEDAMAFEGQVFKAKDNRETLRFEYQNQAFFIKKHFPLGWKKLLKSLIAFRRPSPHAQQEVLAAARLRKLGLNTLTTVAHGSNEKWLAYKASFLITEAQDNTLSLESLAQTQPELFKVRSFKRALILQLAHIARTLHANRMIHRDFYVCHFLCETPINTSAPKIYLIDLHRSQPIHTRHAFWYTKELGDLYFSAMDIPHTRRDVYRFLKAYYQKPLRAIFQTHAKQLKRIQARAQKMSLKATMGNAR